MRLWLLLPRFNASQPHGIRITRSQASEIADREAKEMGIPVEQAWTTLTSRRRPALVVVSFDEAASGMIPRRLVAV